MQPAGKHDWFISLEQIKDGERECKEREDAKRERERESEEREREKREREKKRQEREWECMTLADENGGKRETSLGCGYEERERKRAKRERETGREVFVMGCDGCCCCFFVCFVTVRGLFFGLLSFFTGRLACVQDHAFPQLP
jgi:hypothetical protein